MIPGKNAAGKKEMSHDRVKPLSAIPKEVSTEDARAPIMRLRAGKAGRMYVGSLVLATEKKRITVNDQVISRRPNPACFTAERRHRKVAAKAWGRKTAHGKNPGRSTRK